MKLIRRLSCVAGCVLLLTAPLAPAADEILPPSPLEAFALRPGTMLVWSQAAGRMEGRYARATITAVEYQNGSATPEIMRGVRIELAHASPGVTCDWPYTAWNVMCRRQNAVVFIEEARLAEVQSGLRRGAAELRPFEFISEYGTTRPAFSATGLIICGYEFEGRTGKDLARLLESASTSLATVRR